MNDEINGERNSEGMNMSSGIKKENKKESFLSSLYDWIEVVSISVIIVIMIFTFVARLSTVDGDSMYPTFILPKTEILWFCRKKMHFSHLLL